MHLRIKKHLYYYISFIAIQLAGLSLVLFFAFNKPLQITMMLATTALYIIWALAHQYFHHHLTGKIMVEYVLIGSLGLVMSYFLFSFSR